MIETLTLNELFHGTPYVGYSYGYPHKTAYRELDRAVGLRELWRNESRDALFLYLHIPFCEFRCGFCNLFTVSQPHERFVADYLNALRRQACVVREAIGEAQFARLALGGGTPTFLELEELEDVFDVVQSAMGAAPTKIPVGIEASPATVTAEKLAFLRQVGVDRVSLGVQSFDEANTGAMGRPQRTKDVERALDLIRDAGFPTLNVDLIYGAEAQTIESWLDSVRQALVWRPEEIYLYPLYVRPLTGLGRLDRQWDDLRLSCYRRGRDLLLENGYRQVSMRMFCADRQAKDDGPVYCCQQDGMVGLGCGARSYTRTLHYADRYAVEPRAISAIVGNFSQRDAATFAAADYGFWLDDEDQRRRYAILSLLQAKGLSLTDYEERFASDVHADLPEVKQLIDCGLAQEFGGSLQLTQIGLERSDAIGPWLYSARVRCLMERYQWR